MIFNRFKPVATCPAQIGSAFRYVKREGKNLFFKIKQETVQLDKWFDKNPYPNLEERTNISQIMNIPEKKVRIWFQNKRCKTDEGKMKCFFARNNIQNSDSGEDEEDLQESNYLIFLWVAFKKLTRIF